MTNQEAIKQLRSMLIVNQKETEAVEMAVEALEKQVSKKPDYVSDGWDPEGVGIWDPHCPDCDHNLEDDGEPEHCPNCGQAIDWEGE